MSLVINAWLYAGAMRVYLKIVRNQPVAFGEVFQGGRYLLPMIFASIIYVIVMLVPVFLGFVVSLAASGLIANQSAAGILIFLIGIAVATILAGYLTARLIMCFFLIVDRDAGAIESLLQAWELTRNKAGTMFLVLLLAFAVYMAGILALCVGLIFSLPLACLMITVAYVVLVGTVSPPLKKDELIWEDEL